MATTISTQDLESARRDIDDIGKAVNENAIVSPRYGEDFKSLPMIAADAQTTIGEWESAISLITQEGGVPALAVSDEDGESQQKINNEATRFFKSLSDLLTYKPKNIGQLVNLCSYHSGLQLGGSDLVAIQSGVLTENGVTIFRSLVVGYEDYYWVRINVSELTVEMAGAIPDPDFDSREAFHRCTKLGGEYAMQGEYWAAHPQDDSATRVIPYYDKPITFYSKNRDATLYCTHAFPTTSPYAFGIADFNLRCPLFELRGVKVQGHKTVGHLPKNERTWAVEVRGCDAYWMSENTFSTFNGHSLFIARQAYQTWFTTDPNTSEAVLALSALNSKNGIVEDNHFEHCGSTACGVFGASHLRFRRNTVDIAGSMYPYLIFTDDASSQTALADYCTNDNVFVENCVAPDATIRMDGVASGYVKDCTANLITYRTYDFDQQKENFNSTAHDYNPDDHLNSPFLWMRYLRRNFEIAGNAINKLEVRGAFVYHHDNTYTTTADGVTMINVARNSVLWGTGVSYYDDIDQSGNIRHAESHDNIFVLNHTGCYCSRFDPTFPFSYYSMLESKIHKLNDSIVFTHMLYPSAVMRKDSYTVIGTPYSQAFVNHPVDFSRSMLTQGLGTNGFKAFTKYKGGSGAQPILSVTNTTYDVIVFLRIVATNGLVLQKKVTITPAGGLTVIGASGDTATTWDTGAFTVTTSGGIKSLNINIAAGVDLDIDMQGIGREGDAVFSQPAARSASTG